MTFVDFWAALALILAGMALALRGYMLKPDYTAWVDAPRSVSFAIVALAIVLVGRCLSILGGHHASGAEAVVYTAEAVTAWVLLFNLLHQRPPQSLLARLLLHLESGGRELLEKAAAELGIDPHK